MTGDGDAVMILEAVRALRAASLMPGVGVPEQDPMLRAQDAIAALTRRVAATRDALRRAEWFEGDARIAAAIIAARAAQAADARAILAFREAEIQGEVAARIAATARARR